MATIVRHASSADVTAAIATAASTADSKITTHSSATDPHGDRAAAASALSTHAASRTVHGTKVGDLADFATASGVATGDPIVLKSNGSWTTAPASDFGGSVSADDLVFTTLVMESGDGSKWDVIIDADGTMFRTQHGAIPPSISAISPTNAITTGGQTVTLSGDNFSSTSVVNIGGTAVTTVYHADTGVLTFTSPALSAGTYSITVVDATLTSDAFSYTIITPPNPTVTGLSPTAGNASGGTNVVISGTGFSLGTTVTVAFGGVGGTSVVVQDDNTIACVSPAGSGGTTVDVVVTVDGRTSTTGSPDQFSYNSVVVAAPTLSSISPTSGVSSGGYTATLTGSNFASPATVTFGSVSATNVTVVSATQITCTVPTTAAAGAVSVKVRCNGQDSGTVTFTYTSVSALASFHGYAVLGGGGATGIKNSAQNTGTRLVAWKTTLSTWQPTAPTTTILDLSTYNGTKFAAEYSVPPSLLDFYTYCHTITSGATPQVKIMLVGGSSAPIGDVPSPASPNARNGWMSTHSTKPVKSHVHLDIPAVGSSNDELCVVPGDPDYNFWLNRWNMAVGWYAGQPCPAGVAGSGQWSTAHTAGAHIWGIQNVPAFSASNEMVIGYEKPAGMESQTTTLKNQLLGADTSIVISGYPWTFSVPIGSTQLFLVRLGDQGGPDGTNPYEDIFCTARAASGVLTVAPNAYVKGTQTVGGGNNATGRGWHGTTTPAGGWPVGTTVGLFSLSSATAQDYYWGSTANSGGTKNTPRPLWFFGEYCVDGTTPKMRVGVFEIYTFNRNAWAAVVPTLGAVSSVRRDSANGDRISLKSTGGANYTETGNTETARRRIFARAWIDAFLSMRDNFPATIRCVEYLGSFLGSGPNASSDLTASATQVKAGTYSPDDPTSLVLDWVSMNVIGGVTAPLGGRAVIGFTDYRYDLANVKGFDTNTASQWSVMITARARGIACGMQNKNTQDFANGDEYIAGLEWLIKNYPQILYIEGAEGARCNQKVNLPASGPGGTVTIASHSVNLFPGSISSDVRSQYSHNEYLFGVQYGGAASPDSNFSTYSWDTRMKSLQAFM